MTASITDLKDITPPEGFEEVECAVEFPPCVDWSLRQMITGKVAKMHTVKIRTKDGDKETRLLVLETSDGATGVWESAGLAELFDTLKVGDGVHIHQTGEKKIPGKPSPMRVFRAWRQPVVK